MKTIKLNDGTAVVESAKKPGNALMYANDAQANRKIAELAAQGITASIYRPRFFGPVRFIKVAA